jgi:hypothetical protein
MRRICEGFIRAVSLVCGKRRAISQGIRGASCFNWSHDRVSRTVVFEIIRSPRERELSEKQLAREDGNRRQRSGPEYASYLQSDPGRLALEWQTVTHTDAE